MKASESNVGFESESKSERGRQIIDTKPSATVGTTKLLPVELDEPKEGECLFHSQMWVKGTSFHFIMDSGSQSGTHNLTPLDGSTKEVISASTNSVDCRMTSSPSKMRYCVMLFWANLIYGNVMLYMSLGLVVLLLL